MSQAPPRARRIAAPSWLDVRLVVGIVLVLGSVVAGARVFEGADRYTQLYVARVGLMPGEQVTATDLALRQVRFASGAGAYVGAGSSPVGYVVTRYVGAGELLPAAALSASASAVSRTRLVTVPVAPGHLPQDLARGDLVDVYVTTKGGIARAAAPPARVLAGVPVASYDDGSASLSGDGVVAVALVVPQSAVGRVVAAVEGGEIDLVGVPAVPS